MKKLLLFITLVKVLTKFSRKILSSFSLIKPLSWKGSMKLIWESLKKVKNLLQFTSFCWIVSQKRKKPKLSCSLSRKMTLNKWSMTTKWVKLMQSYHWSRQVASMKLWYGFQDHKLNVLTFKNLNNSRIRETTKNLFQDLCWNSIMSHYQNFSWRLITKFTFWDTILQIWEIVLQKVRNNSSISSISSDNLTLKISINLNGSVLKTIFHLQSLMDWAWKKIATSFSSKMKSFSFVRPKERHCQRLKSFLITNYCSKVRLQLLWEPFNPLADKMSPETSVEKFSGIITSNFKAGTTLVNTHLFTTIKSLQLWARILKP